MEQKRFAYLIGANGPQEIHLAYAEKDVEHLADAFGQPRCAFQVKPVIASSRNSTLAGLKRVADQCQPEDLLLVHFSGHALYDEELFLLCNDSDPNDPTSSAIEITAIKDRLRKCRARQKVLVLDCCHAASAHNELFRNAQDIRGELNKVMQGSASVILSACSRTAQARELHALEGGFLSWAISAACTTNFWNASDDHQALSLLEIWRWIGRALEEVNTKFATNIPLPVLIYEQEGPQNEIWFTTQQRTPGKEQQQSEDRLRKKYLESVCKHYSTVTLPLGPAEGFSLHAIFQPLELQRDPLAAEDLEKRKRRPLLGEREELLFPPSRLPGEASDEIRRESLRVIAENSEDALSKSPQRRLVILGGPGTGKTTTLHYLTGRQAEAALLDPTIQIPLFFSLADFARADTSLQRYLVSIVERLGIEAHYAEILWQEIEDGHAFLCLDSLDEVKPDQRPKMIEQVNRWALDTGNTWVVGSRFTEYKGGQFKRGQFSEWELLPLTHERRLELARLLLPELQRLLQIPPAPLFTPTTFINTIERHPRAAAWGENPLLLSLAAVVFLKTKGLPESRTALYKEVVEAIIKAPQHSEVWSHILLRLLTKLALWLHQYKGRIFSISDLLTFLEDEEKNSKGETAELAERVLRSGIIEPVAYGTYGFRHQTFQEYLAAAELAHRLTHQETEIRERTWQFIWSKRTYSRWAEILRLMVGILAQNYRTRGWQEAHTWLNALLHQKDTPEGDPGNLGLLLVVSSLTEIKEGGAGQTAQIVTLGKEVVLHWAEQLLAVASSEGEREQRLQRLVRDIMMLDQEVVYLAIDQMMKALHHLYENRRWAAAEALRYAGERIPVDALLHTLRSDKDSSVRSVAARALGHAGERIPIDDALLHALSDEDSSVRRTAIETFLLERSNRVSFNIVSLLLADENETVRQGTLEMLGKEFPNAVSLVMTEANMILEKNPPGEIFALLEQMMLADILGGMKVPLPMAFETLQPMLFSPSWQVRVHAIRALGAIRRSIPTPLVTRLLELRLDPDPLMHVVREVADEILAEILSLEAGIEDE